MDATMFKDIIETILLIYVLGTLATILVFWLIISSAVKHGVRKALEEFYDREHYEEDFHLADESELSDW